MSPALNVPKRRGAGLCHSPNPPFVRTSGDWWGRGRGSLPSWLGRDTLARESGRSGGQAGYAEDLAEDPAGKVTRRWIRAHLAD